VLSELQISAIYSAVVICISSALMYVVEGSVQTEQFGSIPRCLWWSVITVTTVGYGDVSPETAAGKIVAAMTACLDCCDRNPYWHYFFWIHRFSEFRKNGFRFQALLRLQPN